MHSPTDASPPSLRTATHGSGPIWIATPSSHRTCTDCSLPVSRRTAKHSGHYLRRLLFKLLTEPRHGPIECLGRPLDISTSPLSLSCVQPGTIPRHGKRTTRHDSYQLAPDSRTSTNESSQQRERKTECPTPENKRLDSEREVDLSSRV